MHAFEIITVSIVGLFAGSVGGLLGIGGSIVMIPALTELLGPDQHLYQATAMIVNFFVVIPAVMLHRRAKAIKMGVVVRLVPLALLAVLCGVALSELPIFSGDNEPYLRGLFGLFLLSVCGYDIYRLFRRRKKSPLSTSPTPQCHIDGANRESDGIGSRNESQTTSWARIAAIAIPTGLIAGLLGVGGGVIAVPLQRRLLGLSIRQAIANSATVIIVTSALGATFKNFAYQANYGSVRQPLLLAATLIPLAIVGSTYGARLTHRLPQRTIKVAFFALLAIAATRLTYGAWLSL